MARARRPKRVGTRVLLLLLWLVLLPVPALAPNAYVVSLANVALVNLILIASLNLLMGNCGQISIGHAGFFGLGAYCSGIMGIRSGLPALLGLPAAMIVTGLVALLIGLPALRLRGHALAMVTLGWNAIIIVLLNTMVSWTGGPNGLLGVPPFVLGPWAMPDDVAVYPLVWACAGATMVLTLHLRESRIGRAMRAVADSELGAAALGVDTFRTKLVVFVIAGALAGMAGSLYVHINQFASPETFGVQTSILLLVMVAVGGAGSFWGPVLGAIVYTAVPQLLLGYDDFELLLFGVALLIVLIACPGGLTAIPAALTRIRRRPAAAP